MSTTFRRLAYVIIKPKINDKKFRNTEKKIEMECSFKQRVLCEWNQSACCDKNCAA